MEKNDSEKKKEGKPFRFSEMDEISCLINILKENELWRLDHSQHFSFLPTVTGQSLCTDS